LDFSIKDITKLPNEIALLISASGGRFPRATPQLPRNQKPLPAGFSAVAFPAGVATLRYNQPNLLKSIMKHN